MRPNKSLKLTLGKRKKSGWGPRSCFMHLLHKLTTQ